MKTVLSKTAVSATTFVECIKACHLTTYVSSNFSSSCGLMLSGPPGVFKTSILEILDNYETAIVISDLNNKTFNNLKGRLTNRTIRTLVIPELQRIYERDPRTASGVEGNIRALVEEGIRGASFEDLEMVRFKAQACVIAALTDALKESRWDHWVKTGFARRFLWVLIRLENPGMIMDAVESGKRLEYDIPPMAMNTPNNQIPDVLSKTERESIRPLVKKQPHPSNVQYELLCRMANVFAYYYDKHQLKKDPIHTIREFALSLHGADLTGFHLE